MNFFGNLSQQLGQVWQGMSLGRRVALVAALVVGLAVVGGVGYWAVQPDYRVAFSGLSPEDAGAVTSKLQAQGIAYKLAAGGTSVLVPADQAQQVRVEMAADGMLKGEKGWGVFDQSPLGMTPFTQHVNYLRALQGELARTIMQIDPIVQARVHIVRPDSTPFIREQKPTTASVMLRLRPGATLNRNVAAGIVALVSRSVEGLTRENVTIIDDKGRVLSEERDPETGVVGTQMDYRRELENYLSSRAESMLAQVVGPGRALVRVTADINFQRHKEKKETYQPDGRVATMEKISSTKSTSSTPGARGPAGTSSNIKGAGGTTPAGGSNSQDETIETSFAVSKITQEFEDKMGAIERLTVAALVDLAPADKDAKDAKEAPKLALADAQDIIKQAVGFKTGRDDIKVTNVKLTGLTSTPTNDEDFEKIQQWQTIANLVRNASLGVAALAALVIGFMVLRRLKPAPGAGAPATPTADERSLVMERLSSTAQQDPQALARVLASWLDQAERPAAPPPDKTDS